MLHLLSTLFGAKHFASICSVSDRALQNNTFRYKPRVIVIQILSKMSHSSRAHRHWMQFFIVESFRLRVLKYIIWLVLPTQVPAVIELISWKTEFLLLLPELVATNCVSCPYLSISQTCTTHISCGAFGTCETHKNNTADIWRQNTATTTTLRPA